MIARQIGGDLSLLYLHWESLCVCIIRLNNGNVNNNNILVI